MGHFTISLPGDKLGIVRSGTVRKMKGKLTDLLRLKKMEREERHGYIVNLQPATGDVTEYHLLKTKEGRWLQKGEHGWLQEGNAETTAAIQQAIDAYEERTPAGGEK